MELPKLKTHRNFRLLLHCALFLVPLPCWPRQIWSTEFPGIPNLVLLGKGGKFIPRRNSRQTTHTHARTHSSSAVAGPRGTPRGRPLPAHCGHSQFRHTVLHRTFHDFFTTPVLSQSLFDSISRYNRRSDLCGNANALNTQHFLHDDVCRSSFHPYLSPFSLTPTC